MHKWFHAQLAQKILNGIQYIYMNQPNDLIEITNITDFSLFKIPNICRMVNKKNP